jgi:hypothetical protein
VRTDYLTEVFRSLIETATDRQVKDQKRIKSWVTSARILLDDGHAVEDIEMVIRYCFKASMMVPNRDRTHITNLKQVRDDYEYLLECAKAGHQVQRRPEWDLFDTSSAEIVGLRKRLEEHL